MASAVPQLMNAANKAAALSLNNARISRSSLQSLRPMLSTLRSEGSHCRLEDGCADADTNAEQDQAGQDECGIVVPMVVTPIAGAIGTVAGPIGITGRGDIVAAPPAWAVMAVPVAVPPIGAT